MLPALLFTVAIIIAVLYLKRTRHRTSTARSLRKTLPVLLFALIASLEGGPVALIVALAFAALGDFALSRDGDRAFLIGMAGFAICHIAYIWLLMPMMGPPSTAQLWVILALLAMGVLLNFVLIPFTGAFAWPVRGYMALIIAFGAVSLTLPQSNWIIPFGALIFILSDFCLAIEHFILKTDGWLSKTLSKTVWITYITAQSALLLGFLF
ncbi:MAG: lysoplasmalogenase family protein [Halocynthiibacter sp.]